MAMDKKTISLAGYVRALESYLADLIEEHESGKKSGDDAVYLDFLWARIDGLCLALRIAGDYDDVIFGVEWARTVERPRVRYEEIVPRDYLPRALR